MNRGAWRARVQGIAESDTTERLAHTQTIPLKYAENSSQLFLPLIQKVTI